MDLYISIVSVSYGAIDYSANKETCRKKGIHLFYSVTTTVSKSYQTFAIEVHLLQLWR